MVVATRASMATLQAHVKPVARPKKSRTGSEVEEESKFSSRFRIVKGGLYRLKSGDSAKDSTLAKKGKSGIKPRVSRTIGKKRKSKTEDLDSINEEGPRLRSRSSISPKSYTNPTRRFRKSLDSVDEGSTETSKTRARSKNISPLNEQDTLSSGTKRFQSSSSRLSITKNDSDNANEVSNDNLTPAVDPTLDFTNVQNLLSVFSNATKDTQEIFLSKENLGINASKPVVKSVEFGDKNGYTYKVICIPPRDNSQKPLNTENGSRLSLKKINFIEESDNTEETRRSGSVMSRFQNKLFMCPMRGSKIPVPVKKVSALAKCSFGSSLSHGSSHEINVKNSLYPAEVTNTKAYQEQHVSALRSHQNSHSQHYRRVSLCRGCTRRSCLSKNYTCSQMVPVHRVSRSPRIYTSMARRGSPVCCAHHNTRHRCRVSVQETHPKLLRIIHTTRRESGVRERSSENIKECQDSRYNHALQSSRMSHKHIDIHNSRKESYSKRDGVVLNCLHRNRPNSRSPASIAHSHDVKELRNKFGKLDHKSSSCSACSNHDEFYEEVYKRFGNDHDEDLCVYEGLNSCSSTCEKNTHEIEYISRRSSHNSVSAHEENLYEEIDPNCLHVDNINREKVEEYYECDEQPIVFLSDTEKDSGPSFEEVIYNSTEKTFREDASNSSKMADNEVFYSNAEEAFRVDEQNDVEKVLYDENWEECEDDKENIPRSSNCLDHYTHLEPGQNDLEQADFNQVDEESDKSEGYVQSLGEDTRKSRTSKTDHLKANNRNSYISRLRSSLGKNSVFTTVGKQANDKSSFIDDINSSKDYKDASQDNSGWRHSQLTEREDIESIRAREIEKCRERAVRELADPAQRNVTQFLYSNMNLKDRNPGTFVPPPVRASVIMKRMHEVAAQTSLPENPGDNYEIKASIGDTGPGSSEDTSSGKAVAGYNDENDPKGLRSAKRISVDDDNIVSGISPALKKRKTLKTTNEVCLIVDGPRVTDIAIKREEFDEDDRKNTAETKAFEYLGGGDPLLVQDYDEDIHALQMNLDEEYIPDPNYISRQDGISWKMRSSLGDWLLDVHRIFKLVPETYHLTMNILDRFLSVRKCSLLKFHLIGLSSLFIAAKFEEVSVPSVKVFAEQSRGQYAESDILSMEISILKALEYKLNAPGPMHFLRRCSRADNYDMETRTLAKYFLDIMTIDHQFIGMKMSTRAAAAMHLSRTMLLRGPWTPELEKYSGHKHNDLVEPVNILVDLLKGTIKYECVFTKYSSSKYMRSSAYARAWLKKTSDYVAVSIDE